MSRVARITKSLSEIKRIIDSGVKLQVIYHSPNIVDGEIDGTITDCRDDSDPYPISVTLAHNLRCTFTSDGYEYENRNYNYITLKDDDGYDYNIFRDAEESIEPPTQPDGKFESFMQMAADEGVSVEVAMKLYKNFK
jgi:hypothetical protein